MAEELGKNFVEFVGGVEYSPLLLGPLESLATVEETSVREKVNEKSSSFFFFFFASFSFYLNYMKEKELHFEFNKF